MPAVTSPARALTVQAARSERGSTAQPVLSVRARGSKVLPSSSGGAFATGAASASLRAVAPRRLAEKARVVQVSNVAKLPGTYEAEVEKPLGVTLKAKGGSGGGVVIGGVAPFSNAAKAGLRSGDQVIYTSSFFGDELWPADSVGFTRSAVQACPDRVYFICTRGVKGEIDVKRLPKRNLPTRFGRKLSAAARKRATHICLDCGYIYALPTPFEEQDRDYVCPQCAAPRVSSHSNLLQS